MNSLRSVTIVGGGIGGLAAAIALRKIGAEVTVLEQAPEIREVGAGLQISPNGLAVLRGLGLDERLADCSVRGGSVSLRDAKNSSEVAFLDLGLLDASQGYFFVHRADLIDLLANEARALGVKIRLFQHVVSVAPGQITMRSGAVIASDLIVGADGLHSVVRAALNETQKPFFTGQVAWRACIPNTESRSDQVRVHMGAKRHIVSYPLRDKTLINLVAVQERSLWASEGWAHQDDPQNLKDAFVDFAPDVQQMLDDVTELHLWGLFRHEVAQTWQGSTASGGLAILGDAAHPTLPFMAQGANLALEDAYVFAACLKTTSIIQGLEAYEDARKNRAKRVISAANGNAWKYHLSFPPLRFAAHSALRLASRFAPGKLLHQFDWLYEYDAPELFGPL